MIKNYYFRIVKNRKFKAGLSILFVVLFIGALMIFFLAGKFRNIETRAQFLLKHPGVTKILPLYWKIRKTTDITYLSYFFKKDEISSYELVIAENDLQKMNDSLPDAFMNVIYTDNVFVPAEFRADGKIYKVRVRYRGKNAVHCNAPKKSYLVKFDKENLFNGMSELNFIIPDDRLFAIEHFNNYRAAKLGLKAPPSGFANLKVNGQKNALYFTIEGWSKEMLEKWNLPKDAELYGNDYGGSWGDIAGWQLLASNSKDFSKLEELISLLNQGTDEEFDARIFDIVDKDNFYAWQIHQELANSSHEGTDNLRLYFDPSKNKFFFIPWDVEIEPLASRDNFGNYETIAKRVFANPAFLQEKNRRLYNYVADEKNLEDDLAFYDRAYESFKVSLYKDRLKIYTNRFADESYAANRQQLIDIFHRLRDRLAAESSARGFDTVRIEDDFNLAYPLGKSDELVSYFKGRYIDDRGFVKELGQNFTSTYGDEDFIDTYFDTPQLDLYQRQAGLRYRVRTNRLDPEDDKIGRELIQLKLSGTDKFQDQDNAGSRNEIKFDVKRSVSGNIADDRNPVISLIAPDMREEFKARVRELGLNPYALRPILTIEQRRRRVYLNRDGDTFISFSMDDASSQLWGADSSFSQMEVELNELAYTAADARLKERMQKIREEMIADLREHFQYLQDDTTIKYTKMFDLLDVRLPWMKFLIRIGILRGKQPPLQSQK